MRKIIPVLTAGATALAVAGGSFAYASQTKDVTVSVDGASSQVSARSETVSDVLEAKGIRVGQHDVVAPALAAPVDDGTHIAVRYGRPVTVKVDGRPRTAWTTATRVDQALAALKVDTTGAALSTSPTAPIGRSGVSLEVATAKTVTVAADGQRHRVRTTGRTVADALKAARITLDRDDLLSVPATKPLVNGASYVATRVDVKTVTRTKKVSSDTVRHRSGKLTKGVQRVRTAGRDGTKTLTYREVRHDGKVVSRKLTDTAVTTKPRTRVVLVGTKVVKPVERKRAEPKPVEHKRVEHKRAQQKTAQQKKAQQKKAQHKSASRSQRKSHSKRNAPSVGSGGVWDKIARCESGGNWSINTGNGFYGGLQFTRSTWRAFGGSGMPHHASRARQIAVAKKVQRSQGWGAWPACTSKLGLR